MNDSSSVEQGRRYEVQRRGDTWVVRVNDRLLAMFASQSVATLAATVLNNQQLRDENRTPLQDGQGAAAASQGALWPGPT